MQTTCFNCEQNGSLLFGYIICDSCKNKLKLFTDTTIKQHKASYKTQNNQTYLEHITQRLKDLEKDFIKKKIKLSHIQKRLKNFE